MPPAVCAVSAVGSGRPASRLRRDLTASTVDGVAYAVVVGLGETYFPAFVLACGHGQVAAGLVATIPPLVGAVLQLASPAGVALVRSLKIWVVGCALVQAFSFAPLLVAAATGTAPLWLIFAAVSLYWGAAYGTSGAWNTWIGMLVPQRIRARFFARRNRLSQYGVLGSLVAGGAVLHGGATSGAPLLAFVLLFAAAGTARVISAVFLSRQSQPQALPRDYRLVGPAELLSRLRHRPDASFLLYLVLATLATQMALPFFPPYVLGRLGRSYADFMLLTAAFLGAKLLSFSPFGKFARRFGTRRLLWLGSLLLIPHSALWAVSDSLTYLLAVQLFGGIAWAAYDLACALAVLEILPEQERTSLLTTYNLFNAAAMTAGSALSGSLLAWSGTTTGSYQTVFIAAAALRIILLPLLLRITALHRTMPADRQANDHKVGPPGRLE
jgi:hypothetical protein